MPFAALGDVGTPSDPATIRRQALKDRLGEIEAQSDGASKAVELKRAKACPSLLSLKDTTYSAYAYALFYPPVHTDAELPSLNSLFGLQAQLIQQATVLSNYCDPQNTKRRPSSDDVTNALAELQKTSGKLKQLVLADEMSKAQPQPQPQPQPQLIADDLPLPIAQVLKFDAVQAPVPAEKIDCALPAPAAPAPAVTALADNVAPVLAVNAAEQPAPAKPSAQTPPPSVVVPPSAVVNTPTAAATPEPVAPHAPVVVAANEASAPPAPPQNLFQCESLTGPASCADNPNDCHPATKLQDAVGAGETRLQERLDAGAAGQSTFSARYVPTTGEAYLKYTQAETGLFLSRAASSPRVRRLSLLSWWSSRTTPKNPFCFCVAAWSG